MGPQIKVIGRKSWRLLAKSGRKGATENCSKYLLLIEGLKKKLATMTTDLKKGGVVAKNDDIYVPFH
jgi:hypothetical protein